MQFQTQPNIQSICKRAKTMPPNCKTNSRAMGDKSTPPINGTTRWKGLRKGWHKRATKVYIGAPGFTQDKTANTNTNALRADTTNWAKPTKLTKGNKAKAPCPPINSHNTRYCANLIKNAPTKLDKSHADHAGTTRRRGNSNQSVTANTNCPKGW